MLMRSRIVSDELVESITLKAPLGLVAISSGKSRNRCVPTISINDHGTISSRAHVNYENFAVIKNFVQESINIINRLEKRRRPMGYIRLDEFATRSDSSLVGLSSPSSYSLSSQRTGS
jgi:hypothetical protein